jgi:hypothetical protein
MPLTQVYGGLEEDPRNEPGVVGFLSLSCIRVFTLLEEDAIVVEHLEHGPDQSGSVRISPEWPGGWVAWALGGVGVRAAKCANRHPIHPNHLSLTYVPLQDAFLLSSRALLAPDGVRWRIAASVFSRWCL